MGWEGLGLRRWLRREVEKVLFLRAAEWPLVTEGCIWKAETARSLVMGAAQMVSRRGSEGETVEGLGHQRTGVGSGGTSRMAAPQFASSCGAGLDPGGSAGLIGGARDGCGPLPLLGMISSALGCRLHSGCTPYVDDRADRCLRLRIVEERAPRRSMTIGPTCSKRHVSRARTDDTSDLPTSPSPGKGANRMLRHAWCSSRAHHMDGVIWTASSLLPSPATVTTGESQGNRPFRLFSVGCALSRTTLTEILS